MKSLALKLSLAIAVLAVLLLALMPKVIGAGIERATIDTLIALIPPEAESQFEIHRSEFSDGWFSSSTSIEMMYTPIGTDAIALTMDFDIDHGPILKTSNGLGIGLAYAVIKPSIRNNLFDIAIADAEFPLPDITFNLLARFDQSLWLNMDVSELSYSAAEGELEFEGLFASLDVAADQSARFSLQMGELSAIENSENSNILISGMEISSSTTQLNDILAESRALLSIPSISSTWPLPFSVSDIGADYGLQASASEVNFSEIYQTIRIASIDSEIPLNSFNWLSEVKQVNNELIRDYYRLLSELQSEIDADSDEVSPQFTALTEELYLLVLRNPLELNNRIEADSYGGDHSAELQVRWSGLSTLNSAAELDINQAIAALNMVLEISLDLEAIMRSPLAGIVDPYAQQGYLAVANGRILVEASLQDSVLRVNGDELPLDQFF
ncbi:MAG: hypothetical protein DHS20C12_25100 [Pseudohongiella sp.]|nr:MAG: hypothetical protein DHS20C12_25100 [Pseudohongiella sp.]